MQQGTVEIVTKTELKATKATLQSVKNLEEICCRICLEEMTPSETFSVCKCKGANGHVHEKCLLQWAKKAQKYRESYDTYFYHCQICKEKILLQVVTRLKCLQCRQISFCGEDFCCTVSSSVILLMGVAMLIAGLYLKLSSEDRDIEYLFDLTLSLSAIIIVVDVVLSTMYYLLYNEVVVVGIKLSQQQRKQLKKVQECKVGNSHGVEDQEKKANKVRNNDINQTEMFFAEDNNREEVREVEEARFQTQNQGRKNEQSLPRQVILFPEEETAQHLQANQQVTGKQDEPEIDSKKQIIQQPVTVPINQLQQLQHSREQNLLRKQITNQAYNIGERDFSVSTIQQCQTQSIFVKSISIRSKGDYRNNLSSWGNSPMNDCSSTYSHIENETGHNQIMPLPNSMMVKKPSPLTRFRRTLNQSMIRSEIHLMEQRRRVQQDNQQERVSQEEQENDVEIYYPRMNGSKIEAHIKHYSSLVEGEIKKELEQQ